MKGEGVFLFDARGRRYLDFTSGIGVTNTGHCHPRIVAAVREQAGRLLHAQVNVIYHEPMMQLVEELRRVVPEGLDTFFFANSGAEAVEASIKLARKATGRPNVIVFQGGFHGRTLGTVSLTTSKRIVRSGYQPLLAGVVVAPYPHAYRYGWPSEATLAWCLDELRHLLETQTAPEETAAVLVEPVLGEGGYVVPPPGFLPALRDLCDEHGVLLIVDEVQTGFGRTGEFFAIDHSGTRLDILIMAKALASGLPLSAIVARGDLMARWPAGSHGTTFGGNVLACAAAVATIGVIRDEKLVENAVTTPRLPRPRRLQAGLQRAGGSAVPIPFSEVYTSIMTGVVDGAEVPVNVIYTNKFHEGAKHLSVTRHTYTPTPFIMNLKLFQTLPAGDQQIVVKAAREAAASQRALIDRRTNEFIELLKKDGVHVYEVDQEAFRARALGVYKEFEDKIGKDLIQAVLQAK